MPLLGNAAWTVQNFTQNVSQICDLVEDRWSVVNIHKMTTYHSTKIAKEGAFWNVYDNLCLGYTFLQLYIFNMRDATLDNRTKTLSSMVQGKQISYPLMCVSICVQAYIRYLETYLLKCLFDMLLQFYKLLFYLWDTDWWTIRNTRPPQI